jgi:hypothetical protein
MSSLKLNGNRRTENSTQRWKVRFVEAFERNFHGQTIPLMFNICSYDGCSHLYTCRETFILLSLVDNR